MTDNPPRRYGFLDPPREWPESAAAAGITRDDMLAVVLRQREDAALRERQAKRAARGSARPRGGPRPHGPAALSRGELAALPGVQPLVDGVLDRRSFAVLAGPWGSGKSFTALGWAASVATGVPWAGRAVSAPGRVVYVAAEGLTGLHARLSAWEEHHGVPVADESLAVVPAPVDLTDPAAAAGLAEVAAGARLVIIDCLARCVTGADENDASDMGKIVEAVDGVRAATEGGTVLVVHVTGKGGATARGSSALEAAADTVWRLARHDTAVTLPSAKFRDRAAPESVALRLAKLGPSAVLVADDAAGGAEVA